MDIRSKAAHVLATSDNDDAKSLAGYVLGGDSETKAIPTRSEPDLTRLLNKISGMEGQYERVQEVKRMLASIGAGK